MPYFGLYFGGISPYIGLTKAFHMVGTSNLGSELHGHWFDGPIISNNPEPKSPPHTKKKNNVAHSLLGACSPLSLLKKPSICGQVVVPGSPWRFFFSLQVPKNSPQMIPDELKSWCLRVLGGSEFGFTLHVNRVWTSLMIRIPLIDVSPRFDILKPS